MNPAVARYISLYMCEEHDREVSEWWAKEPEYIREDHARFEDLTPEQLEALPSWWYTLEEVAEMRNRKPTTVRGWIRAGKLGCIKPKRDPIRVTHEDLRAFAEGRPPDPKREYAATEDGAQSASAGEQDHPDRQYLSAEDTRKWKEAAEFVVDLARSARHVNEFAKLVLREAERRCKEAYSKTTHTDLRRRYAQKMR